MAAVLLGTATAALDSAVNIDFPRIVIHFGQAVPRIQWLVISYTLASASLILIFGRLGDLIGHRRIFVAGAAWSFAAFLICSSAANFWWLLVGRVLQGIGAGLVLSCGPALAASLYAPTLRARGLATYTAGFGWAGAFGPALGGAMLAHFDWSCVFWARAPMAAAAFFMAASLPPSAHIQRGDLRAFDIGGGAWIAATLASGVLAIGAIRQPALAIGAAAVAGGGVFRLVRRERNATAPIIRLHYFCQAGFGLLNLSSVIVNLASFAVLLIAPFALAVTPGLSQSGQGLLLATSPLGVALAAPIAGRLEALGCLGSIAGGTAIASLGLLIIAWAPLSPGQLAAGMFITGLGTGLFQVGYLDRLTGAMPTTDRGIAGSLAMLTRTLGIVLGAALLMQIFQILRAGTSDLAGLQLAFRTTFFFAASLPGVLLIVWLTRLQVLGRNT